MSTTGDNFSAVFASMDDEYMKARSVDVLDISKRVVNVLAGIVEGGIASEVPVILLADDLSPSETVQLDKSKILAFVTKNGSANSHTGDPGAIHEHPGAGQDGCGAFGRV